MKLIATFIAFMVVQVTSIFMDDYEMVNIAQIDALKANTDTQLVQTESSVANPRSIEWGYDVWMWMENHTGKQVQLYWYDYHGNPTPYDIIEPGQS